MRLLLQQRHVQVAAGAPLALRDVLEPRGHEHEGGPAVGEGAYHPRPATYLAVEPLDGVVGAYAPPVLAGKPGVRQRLGVAVHDDPGRLLQPGPLELRGHLERLGLGGPARLHGVDGLEHGRDLRPLGLGYLGQHVAVEVHGAALVGGFREHLGDRADHAGGLVAREHAHAAQPARLEPREGLPPALGRLGEPLGRADDLALAVVVGAYGHHHRHVLVGASPASLEVDPVDADVGVGALEGAVAPLLDRGERLLVEVRDGGGRDARAPEDLAHVLDAPGGDPGEVHLDHRLLDRGLPAPVVLDDGRREPHALELGHADGDLARGGRELPLVVAGAVGFLVGGALVAPGAH